MYCNNWFLYFVQSRCLSFVVLLGLLACNKPVTSQGKPASDSATSLSYVNQRGDTIRRIQKTESEWKAMLSPSEFYVLRQKGTERPFTGDLLENKKEGIYTCRGCGLPLFHSKHKFNSGTGWPSFFDVFDTTAVAKDTDYDIGYPRTELTCARCGGHLGHVFDDGPRPTGLRYCINAVSLDFVEEKNGN